MRDAEPEKVEPCGLRGGGVGRGRGGCLRRRCQALDERERGVGHVLRGERVDVVRRVARLVVVAGRADARDVEPGHARLAEDGEVGAIGHVVVDRRRHARGARVRHARRHDLGERSGVWARLEDERGTAGAAAIEVDDCADALGQRVLAAEELRAEQPELLAVCDHEHDLARVGVTVRRARARACTCTERARDLECARHAERVVARAWRARHRIDVRRDGDKVARAICGCVRRVRAGPLRPHAERRDDVHELHALGALEAVGHLAALQLRRHAHGLQLVHHVLHRARVGLAADRARLTRAALRISHHAAHARHHARTAHLGGWRIGGRHARRHQPPRREHGNQQHAHER